MKKPLFEIGETVVRQAPSPYYSEYNGEYIVESIITRQDYEYAIPGVKGMHGFYYKLRGLAIHLENFAGDKTGKITSYTWEGFLRKKHKPSELSFQELVSSLTTPIKA